LLLHHQVGRKLRVNLAPEARPAPGAPACFGAAAAWRWRAPPSSRPALPELQGDPRSWSPGLRPASGAGGRRFGMPRERPVLRELQGGPRHWSPGLQAAPAAAGLGFFGSGPRSRSSRAARATGAPACKRRRRPQAWDASGAARAPGAPGRPAPLEPRPTSGASGRRFGMPRERPTLPELQGGPRSWSPGLQAAPAAAGLGCLGSDPRSRSSRAARAPGAPACKRRQRPEVWDSSGAARAPGAPGRPAPLEPRPASGAGGRRFGMLSSWPVRRAARPSGPRLHLGRAPASRHSSPEAARQPPPPGLPACSRR